MKNFSASEPRDEMLPADPPALRYPMSAVRYPFLWLTESRPKPARNSERIPNVLARLRRMKRGAHTLLWWLPLWYILGQLVLLAWIDERWEFERTRVEHEKWKQLHERLAEAPDRPLVLMLGSSRSDWAFQAGRLSGQPGPDGRPLLAYNLAVPTTGPLHEALYLNDLLSEGIRPRLLLVEFVTTHLNQSQRGLLSEEHFTMAQWLSGHQVLFMQPYFSNKRRMLTGWLESRLASWYAYRCAVHDHLQGHHSLTNPYDQQAQPMDEWGCRLLYNDPNTPQFRVMRWAGAAKMYGESLKHFRLGPGPVQAMRDVLDRCRREQIPVALVRMPVTKEFHELFPAQARADLDNLFAELSEGVFVIDASDWLSKKDFDDGHHVRRVGASKYTTRMIEEVHKILARTEPQ
ncbi:MAG: hypothetical protein ACYC3I_21100 [Gemmataceae bacterium]